MTEGPNEPLSGWRAAILDEVARIREFNIPAEVSSLYEAMGRATEMAESGPKSQPRSGRLRLLASIVTWLADRVLGREDRRYVAALTAIYRAREIAALHLPDEALVARLPQLRSDVKRFIDPAEPQFEVYLRLLDLLEASNSPRPAVTLPTGLRPSPVTDG